MSKLFKKRVSTSQVLSPQKRSLRLELLEDRRMLSATADILFLLDKSGSVSSDPAVYNWLKDKIFTPATGQPNPIVQKLVDKGINETDVRYGLIGFGAAGLSSGGFAHSHIIDPNATDPLFGTADQVDAMLESLYPGGFGGHGEDGWDAFEHVISEYRFRPGSVPIVVLLQNREGRNHTNATLVREGVLAALESKNVSVTTLVYGSDQSGDPAKMFDLALYSTITADQNIRILGVESDHADNIPDGQHNFVGIDTATSGFPVVNTASQNHSDALQVSYNGSNTGATGMVASGKSILFSKTANSGIGPSTAGYKATSVNYAAATLTGSAGSVPLSGGTINLPFAFNYYGQPFVAVTFDCWLDVG
jgi:hypothetical protein